MQGNYLRKIILLFLISLQASAQKYCVYFTDKKDAAFNPYTYFDIKAIERKLQDNLPIYDITDLPVNNDYLNEVYKHVDSVSIVSRWLNAVVVYEDNEKNVDLLKYLPFVTKIEKLSNLSPHLCSVTSETASDIELLKMQTSTLGGNKFRANSITGKGIRIAIFDAGYKGVDKNNVFKALRDNGQILKTYDFLKKKDFVYDFATHGTAVLSCIAGTYNNIPVGLATDAEFILARTEHPRKEPFSEEENWLAAAEWADKNGAQIISSSLGYTDERYFPEDMNGHQSLVSKAANMAARKGMLVISAAGNEGSGKWNIISTPADADSVLSVGGINPSTGIHTGFSSYGPTYDFRMKPNVCAYGHVYAASEKEMEKTQGTSFSCPLISGFAACAWQTNKSLNNMQLFDAIQRSATLYPYFDYAHGYGVPQASYFVKGDTSVTEKAFTISRTETGMVIIVTDKILDNPNAGQQLFYHFKNAKGRLLSYTVINMEHAATYEILDIPENAVELMVFFNSYTETFKL